MLLLFALTGPSRTLRPGWNLELAIRVEGDAQIAPRAYW